MDFYVNSNQVYLYLETLKHFCMKPLLLFLAAFLFLYSCKKQDIPDGNITIPEIEKGIITGKIVAANKKTAVRNAIVFITDSSNVYSTYTDINGNFSLEAPAGLQKLHIQSGSGNIFRTDINVIVVAKTTTAISTEAIQLNQVSSLAYIPGTYDKIEAILIDSLGYSATEINYAALNSINLIKGFSAIFINCTSGMNSDWLKDSVLAVYVANGGSLYTSDYAVSSLIGMVAPPCPNPRPGGFIGDSLLCTQRIGTSGTLNNASITSPTLQTYLNKNTMNVKFDLGSWESVQNFNSNFWEVMVTHPTTNAPLLLRTENYTNSSAGSVVVGPGSNNNMVTICHKPQGSLPVTITIPQSELAFHLAHGDSQGSCNSVNGAGRIYYTTFHNHPNGLISSDMKHILDFIILNL